MSKFITSQKSLEASKMVFIKALSEVLPFAKPLRSGMHEPMWFVDFYYEGSLDDKIIPMIEESMRKLVKEGLPIKYQEMLLSNAVEFWLFHQNKIKAEGYQDEEDLVHSFLLLDKILEECESEAPASTADAFEAQVLSFKSLDQDVWRVWGSCFAERSEQKEYKKLFQIQQKASEYEPIPCELEEGRAFLWKKKGSDGLQKMMKHLFAECENEKISYLFTPPEKSKFKWHLELFKQSGAKSWRSFELAQNHVIQKNSFRDDPFTTDFPTRDHQFRFFSEEKMVQELISSLQLIERTTTIFGLKGEWHIRSAPKHFGSKKRFEQLFGYVTEALSKSNVKATETKTKESATGLSVEYLLVDSLERRWPGSLITILDKPIVIQSKGSKENRSEAEGLEISVFQSFERWMSFLED